MLIEPQLTWLGVETHGQDFESFISAHLTNMRHKKSLFYKERLLQQNFKNFNNLPRHLNVCLTKTMFAAYTQIFGQVLPTTDLEDLNKIALESLQRLTGINCIKGGEAQFHSFLGIPMPTHKWHMLRLVFYRMQLKHKKGHSYIADWLKKPADPDLPYITEIKSLLNQWIPNWNPETDLINEPNEGTK